MVMKPFLGKTVSFLIIFLIPIFALGETDNHWDMAEEFYELTSLQDPPGMVQLLTDLMLRNDPGLETHREIFENFITDIVQSKEYRDHKIRTYMQFFTKEELEELNQVFRNDAFQKYQARKNDVMWASSQGTLKIFERRKAELEMQLRDAIGNVGNGPVE